MATATTPGRPPLPPFTRERAIQKVRVAEMAGTVVILQE